MDAKAPTSHASTGTTYGLGTTSNYGHVKTVNGLTQASHSNGTALSAYQGYVLKGLIDAKSDFSGSYNDLTDVPTSFPPTSHNHDDRYYTESEVDTLLDDKLDISDAFSGSYNDLTNKPSIPSSSSDLSDGSDLIKKSSTTGLIKNNGTIDTNTYLTSSAIANMLTTSDITNNLTTTTAGKVLDARQGKALADLIGDAITYINQ